MNAPANARPDRVVVVDDDARIRDLLRRYLTQEGFEVLLAEDAKALNRVLTRDTVDLIVLDLMLPRLSGLEVCRALRADPRHERLKILMLTARGRTSDLERGKAAGVDAYQVKPFSTQELLAQVRLLLAMEGMPHAS